MSNKDELAPAGQATSGQLGIQKIYIKDFSFEAPNAPQIFTEQLTPSLDVQFGNAASVLAENVHEVVLTVTCTVKQDDRTVYLVEVQQAGIFNISGFNELQLPAILASACPNILFPFAREAISEVVSKGGFPQLLLAPVNFDAVYAQELQRRRTTPGSEAQH
jgi:preprotein translocase subunit SecB